MQWCRGGLRVAEKVSSKRNQYPLTRIKDEYGSEWLESIAMTPQGIQPGSEEKR